MPVSEDPEPTNTMTAAAFDLLAPLVLPPARTWASDPFLPSIAKAEGDRPEAVRGPTNARPHTVRPAPEFCCVLLHPFQTR
jgi:hypothetical protein